MSLNRYEQAIFDYWERQPDEKRHWQAKVVAVTARAGTGAEAARSLERELRGYAQERSAHVAPLRELADVAARLSLLNLAEYLIRVWGPLPKPKRAPQ